MTDTDTTARPTAPEHLSKEGRELFDWIVENYKITDQAALATLTLALEAYDRSAAARRKVKREGMTYEDFRGQPKPHPAVAIQREAAATWKLLLGQLGIPETIDQRDRHGHYSGRKLRNRGRAAAAHARPEGDDQSMTLAEAMKAGDPRLAVVK